MTYSSEIVVNRLHWKRKIVSKDYRALSFKYLSRGIMSMPIEMIAGIQLFMTIRQSSSGLAICMLVIRKTVAMYTRKLTPNFLQEWIIQFETEFVSSYLSRQKCSHARDSNRHLIRNPPLVRLHSHCLTASEYLLS